MDPHKPVSIETISLFRDYNGKNNLPEEGGQEGLVLYAVEHFSENPAQAKKILKDIEPYSVMNDAVFLLTAMLAIPHGRKEPVKEHVMELFRFYGPRDDVVANLVGALDLCPEDITELLLSYGPQETIVTKLVGVFLNQNIDFFEKVTKWNLGSKSRIESRSNSYNVLKQYGKAAIPYIQEQFQILRDDRLVSLIKDLETT